MNPRPQRQRPGTSSPLRPNPEPLKVGDQVSSAHSQDHRATESQTPVVTESETTGVPKYRTLVRKEARVRGDQADELAQLRRRLTARRADRSEVLTDNTLIRVAIDLLLTHADQLHGDTEDQLCESVTHRLTE